MQIRETKLQELEKTCSTIKQNSTDNAYYIEEMCESVLNLIEDYRLLEEKVSLLKEGLGKIPCFCDYDLKEIPKAITNNEEPPIKRCLRCRTLDVADKVRTV